MHSPPKITSTLEIFDISTNTREIIYSENGHFEAPNWSPDGSYLLMNSEGSIFKLDLRTKKKSHVATGRLSDLNNDHGISPDGTHIVISSADAGKSWLTSKIYTLPASDGDPKLITPKEPSFWHGWSPDGQRLTYVARRNAHFDIYSIASAGGKEVRLTDGNWLDDGPDFSHDGQFIYYNSMRSGSMEIWRMRFDGSDKVQLTHDHHSNWFPHPSPDGSCFVYLSYKDDQGEAHPPMKEVALKLFDLNTEKIKILCEFTGGQGSINVPSWSPDGKKFAFVSYQWL